MFATKPAAKRSRTAKHARLRSKGPLKMTGIRKKAKALGITPGKMKKTELVHSIQQAEGFTPCFGQSNGQCAETNCCFLSDCVKISP